MSLEWKWVRNTLNPTYTAKDDLLRIEGIWYPTAKGEGIKWHLTDRGLSRGYFKTLKKAQEAAESL